jgi:hypothetical protein
MSEYQSDYMVCKDVGFLQYSDKKYNDLIFTQTMDNTQKWCIRNIDNENKLFATDKLNGIYFNKYDQSKWNYNCPDMVYSEYLLTPCQHVDYKNYMVGDKTKKCSKRHQALNNWTKRK